MWAVLIPIIAQYGLPFAESLFQKWSTNAAPTQADFDALKSLASVTAGQIAAKQLSTLGIAPGTASIIKGLTGS